MSIMHRMTNVLLRRAWTGSFRTKPCGHLDHVEQVQPSALVCEACVALGDTWPALRMCLICGYVGCCDRAKNRHAMKHFEKRSWITRFGHSRPLPRAGHTSS